MELTRKEIEMLASGDMTYNELRDKYTTISCIPIRKIAQMLLAEMDAPKVWTNAPDNAVRALTYFYDDKRSFINEKEYTRKPTKSRIDEIAEEAFFSMCDTTRTDDDVIDIIKSAILQASKEWEARDDRN